MRVGLIDVDSHNFPNLCLMKLSEYHTRHGDRVEWWAAKQYDLVYKSRVFTDTYSKDTIQVSNADKVIQGGTGYGPGENLPHEIDWFYSAGMTSISAVFRYSLRLFKPWLSKELRILYCQQKRRAQERPGG